MPLQKVLILGGYGNFGKRIAQMLTRQNIAVILAGRDHAKAQAVKDSLPPTLAEIAIFDANSQLAEALQRFKPAVLINTCGPFQTRDYAIAETCIAAGVHYLDLADGRDFVTNITTLHEEAVMQRVAVISGASTVPALTAAVVEHYLPQFSHLHRLHSGIATGQRAERGLATTQAILGYVGKKLKPCAGHPHRYGWQDLYRQPYPLLGTRWMANADVPDLDLLPQRFGLSEIQFSVGMEVPFLHLGIWLLSWLIRMGLPLRLENHAATLLRLSNCLNFLGSADGGMHLTLQGEDSSGNPQTLQWFIIALGGDGPYIPTVPAVILAKKILQHHGVEWGARACTGLITLEEYLHELHHLNIQTFCNISPPMVGMPT
jgi:hypothetical protein